MTFFNSITFNNLSIGTCYKLQYNARILINWTVFLQCRFIPNYINIQLQKIIVSIPKCKPVRLRQFKHWIRRNSVLIFILGQMNWESWVITCYIFGGKRHLQTGMNKIKDFWLTYRPFYLSQKQMKTLKRFFKFIEN